MLLATLYGGFFSFLSGGSLGGPVPVDSTKSELDGVEETVATDADDSSPGS